MTSSFEVWLVFGVALFVLSHLLGNEIVVIFPLVLLFKLNRPVDIKLRDKKMSLLCLGRQQRLL